MRRILAALCALMLVFGITGCAADRFASQAVKNDENFYCGTWVYYGFESDDAFLTAKEYDELYGTDSCSYYFVLKSDGTGCDYLQDGTVDEYSWKVTKKGVIIDDFEFILKDNMIYGDFENYIAYFIKESSSQAFPKEEKYETLPSAPAVTTAPQTTAPETTSPPLTTFTDSSADESDGISPTSGIMYVKDNVNVRKGPGTEFGRVGHLNKGKKVEITGKAENGWYRIKFNDGEYFVSGNYLAEEQPAQSSASTEASSIATTAKPETTSPTTTKAPETVPSTTTQKRLTEDDIRPEFKELMDQYEAFFDDYIAFMKKYMSASSDDPMAMLGMLQDYLDWLEKYSEVMEDFEDVGDSDLTRAETFYYAEVALRIEQKLLSVMY